MRKYLVAKIFRICLDKKACINKLENGGKLG